MLKTSRRIATFLFGLLWIAPVSADQAETDHAYHFGVLNQRSVLLTAQYWNPILRYVSQRSGVPLDLRMGKTAVETTAMTVRGDFAFVYTNHLFTPGRIRLGYRVIARPDAPDIQAYIIVRENSSLRSLVDLEGKTVVFPSKEAFVGYWVPMDALLKAGVNITPTFGSNQEGAMSQLQAGAADAAAVNDQILQTYRLRENFRYRILWHSGSYHEMPIMANPAVPLEKINAVRNAFIGMLNDPQGRRVLEASAKLLKLDHPVGFVMAEDRDYNECRSFFQKTVMKSD